MADTDDTSKVRPSRNPSARSQLEKTIEAEREQLMQAHGVLTCLYDALLHAEDEMQSPTRRPHVQPHVSSIALSSAWTACGSSRCSMRWRIGLLSTATQ